MEILDIILRVALSLIITFGIFCLTEQARSPPAKAGG
jgi:hypothetical protein